MTSLSKALKFHIVSARLSYGVYDIIGYDLQVWNVWL